MSFFTQPTDGFAVVLVAALALVVGYLLGRLHESAVSEPRQRGTRTTLVRPTDALPEVRALLASGDKLGAIRRLRVLTGVGLAEAKAAVDALGHELALERVGLRGGAGESAPGRLSSRSRAPNA